MDAALSAGLNSSHPSLICVFIQNIINLRQQLSCTYNEQLPAPHPPRRKRLISSAHQRLINTKFLI